MTFWDVFDKHAYLFTLIIVIGMAATANLCNRFLRHMNIRKHGYPPVHCDADGDFREDDDY